MEIKISVVIPVYSVEQYLEMCVQSVRRQTYQNIEIILVDDGSPDQSPEICDCLKNQDQRIKVIHKENGGLSDSRNVGVQNATGDYVLFLDGDDFWDDDKAIERLVERVKIRHADVVNFSYKKYFEDTGEKSPYFYGIEEMRGELQSKEQQLEFLTKRGLYIASACNKLIRRGILDKTMEFQKGMYSEDIEWCARLLLRAKSLDFVCENFYCYRQRKDSITHTISKKKCDDLCSNILTCFKIAERAEEKEQLFVRRYTAYQYGTFFKVQAQSKEEAAESIQALDKYRWILDYHCGDKKLQCLRILCCLLGFKTTCKLIRCIYGVRR